MRVKFAGLGLGIVGGRGGPAEENLILMLQTKSHGQSIQARMLCTGPAVADCDLETHSGTSSKSDHSLLLAQVAPHFVIKLVVKKFNSNHFLPKVAVAVADVYRIWIWKPTHHLQFLHAKSNHSDNLKPVPHRRIRIFFCTLDSQIECNTKCN